MGYTNDNTPEPADDELETLLGRARAIAVRAEFEGGQLHRRAHDSFRNAEDESWQDLKDVFDVETWPRMRAQVEEDYRQRDAKAFLASVIAKVNRHFAPSKLNSKTRWVTVTFDREEDFSNVKHQDALLHHREDHSSHRAHSGAAPGRMLDLFLVSG